MSDKGSRREWDVHVLEYARSKDQPLADLIQGAVQDGVLDLPFGFVLARRGEAVVLVDSGFMRDGSGEQMSRKFNVPYWISPLRLLKELGVAPGDVTDIVLTHAHFDHMGSIDRFPRARLHLQKRELLAWIEYLALPPRFGWLTQIVNPDDVRHLFDASVEHRLHLVDGDVNDLFPGLHLRLGAGHTPGHQFVAIDTARGRLAIAGDCIYAQRQVTGKNEDGVYVPLTNALGTALDQLMTIDRIHQEIGGDLSRLILMHDPEGWPQLPLVKDVEGFRIRKAS